MGPTILLAAIIAESGDGPCLDWCNIANFPLRCGWTQSCSGCAACISPLPSSPPAMPSPPSPPLPPHFPPPPPMPNFVLGTQAIYSATWSYYYFTPAGATDTIAEQTAAVVEMGLNQFKFRLSSTTCIGYRIQCDANIDSLTVLARQSPIAALLASPSIRWYHFWMVTYNAPEPLNTNWTSATLQAEYDETFELATHLLSTYNGTDKVFMAGNWEGDWMLLGPSGCKGLERLPPPHIES